jgi:arylsulfatase A-like enzyme
MKFGLLVLIVAVMVLAASGRALAQPSPAPAPTTRPNIVFVLIDDMGYGDLGCFDKRAAPTPRIDQVCHEGIKFTQFYVNAPICSPSRTALLTGQYPYRWKINSYIDNRALNEKRGMAQWLDLSAPSIAREMQKAGYATGHFGKWHMGGGRDVGEAPVITEYGFDKSLTQFEGLGDRLLGSFDRHDGTKPERSGLCTASEKLGHGKVEWVDRSEETGIFADRAMAFMDQSIKDKKPFFVDVWPDDVHSPFYPPKALRTSEAKRDLYRAVVQATDMQLVKLFDYLRDKPELKNNTIVVIASDNGPEPGAGSPGPFKGHKSNLYEGGVREPFIVWAPGLMEPSAVGTTNDVSVIAGMDFPPSILELAGVPPPAGVKYDGQSFARTMLGHDREIRQTPIFWRRPTDRPGTAADPFPDLSMRDGDWKFLCMLDGSSPQLYDLKSDIGEKKNLAAREPDRVKKMTAAALAWNATMPVNKLDKPRPPQDGDNGG